jgi:hypothetical protein
VQEVMMEGGQVVPPPKIYQFSASLKYKYILFIWRNLNISNMYIRKTGAKS